MRLAEVERTAAEDWGPLIAAGYLPFAIGEDGQGPVCFNLERRSADGDCPVVWMTRDSLFALEPKQAGKREYVEPNSIGLFDSFEDMKEVWFGR